MATTSSSTQNYSALRQQQLNIGAAMKRIAQNPCTEDSDAEFDRLTKRFDAIEAILRDQEN